MAWYRGKIGGGMTETVLWINTSPTSSFAKQQISLNQSFADFTYIGMYCRKSTSDSTKYFSMIRVSDLTYLYSSSAYESGQTLSVTMSIRSGSSSAEWARQCAKSSSSDYSTLWIMACVKITVGSGTSNTTSLIPTKIVGLK